MRLVRQHRGVPDEERLLRCGGDEVVNRLHRLPADHESFLAVPALGRHPLREPGVGVMPFPEFSRLETAIAGFAEQPRQGRRLLDEGMHRRPIDPVGRIVAADLVLMGVQAGEERRQTGPAERRGDVGVRKQRTLGRQSIEPRRLDDLVSHEPEVGPPLVVGHDHDDVRRALGGERGIRADD